MTHLEIYLETLRDLPLVAARQAAWLHTLDTKANALQRDVDVAQEEILSLCKSGSSPTPEQLQKLRTKQWEAYAMCQEKMALAAEWSKILESYSIRLSEEMEAYEQELPPELLRQTLDGGASGKKPTTSDVKKKGKVSEKEIELLPATTSGTAAATLGNLTGNATNAVTPLPSSSSSTTSSTTTPAISAVGGTNKIRIKNPVKLQPSSSSGNLKAKSTKQKLEDEALGLTHDISGADEPESDDLLISSTTPATVSVPTSTSTLVDQAVYSTEEDYPPTKITGPPALKHKNPDGSAGVGVPSDEVFCTCRQVSFGEMIGCDDPKCRIEWFHFACVGLTQKPKSGSWYCDECKARNAKA